jgi:branched-chain amino acid transport system permease protein
METFLQVFANGLMLGGLFAIVSIGLTLIFGIVRVVNFAHGEFLMVGMYLVFLIATGLNVHPYVTAAAVVPLLFVIGAATQRFIIQPLLSATDEHVQIFATVGLSTALINLALLVFGADIATTPSSDLRQSFYIGPVRILAGQAVIFVLAAILVCAIHLFLTRTQTGRAIRATAQNRTAAQLMGVNVRWMYVLTFGIGAACVGLAAVLVAPLYPTSPTIGTYFVLTAFVVVVLGGLGSIGGAFLGAMIIGLVDSFAGFYIGSDLREVAVFGIFLLILIFRPSGLFGSSMNLSHVSP